MTHLSEGTIHAWLDGALSAAESREAETHVAACADCSARVAEARGFIAGASRILTALDDVPAGVIPERLPSATPAIRQWRAAPWVTSIAAVLVLTIGIATLRKPAPEFAKQRSIQTATPVAVGDSVAAVVPRSQPTSPAVPGPRAVAKARSVAPTRALPLPSAVASGAGAAADLARGSVAAPALPRADAEAQVATPLARLGDMAKKAEALPAPAPSKDVRDDAPLARSRDRETAGCYRLEGPGISRTLAAPSAVALRARETSPRAAPTVVRLDTTAAPPGYLARDTRTGAPFGVWFRTAGDSLRIEAPSAGTFILTAAAKVSCP